MDCYILQTVLLVIILLFIIAIIGYYYAKQYEQYNNKKMENNVFKKISFENSVSYCFNDIIKFGDFDFDNISMDENSHENILIYFI